MVTATTEITATAARKLTVQDYFALDAPDGERYELINGELIMAAAPNLAHQVTGLELGSRMNAFAKANELGQVVIAPFDVLLSDTDVVQPDILFVSNERAEIITPANARGAPDLVVEVISPSSERRDWREKLALYAKHGVKEYWIIDPINRIIWLMLLRRGILEIAGKYGEGYTVSSTALAGFSVKVDDIF